MKQCIVKTSIIVAEVSTSLILLHTRLSNENGTLAEIGTFSIELLHEQKSTVHKRRFKNDFNWSNYY